MKYKVISIITIISVLIASFVLSNINIKGNRYHQHLEANKKAACTNHSSDTFCTHLPLINVVTDKEMPSPYMLDENNVPLKDESGNYIQNDETVSATIEYFDNENNNNHLKDQPDVKERALTRIRGASSRSFDKKGYLIKFKQEDLIENKDVALSGMTKDSDWVLHGPILDKTLIRNYLCYNLSGEIMGYSPNVRFCEMFLNGEYMGLYLLTEKIGYNKDGRVNITKTDENMIHTSYIVMADRGTTDKRFALETFGNYGDLTTQKELNSGQLEVVYPSKTLTENQRKYIENDLSRFEKSLFSFDYNDPKLGYKKYIDVQSFVDYFLINEFTLNYDAGELSTYLYKDIRGKINLVVWDFNSAFDNYQKSLTSPQTFEIQKKFWYKQLFKDEKFVDAVIKRYNKLRKTYFNEEYLLNYIDETISFLGPAIDRNYEKWGYSFEENDENDYLIPVERNPRSYDEAVNQLKNCIVERGAYMDNNIDRLYSLSHSSVNKKYNHTTRSD